MLLMLLRVRISGFTAIGNQGLFDLLHLKVHSGACLSYNFSISELKYETFSFISLNSEIACQGILMASLMSDPVLIDL